MIAIIKTRTVKKCDYYSYKLWISCVSGYFNLFRVLFSISTIANYLYSSLCNQCYIHSVYAELQILKDNLHVYLSKLMDLFYYGIDAMIWS
jgi:hypothetical protein